MKILALDQSTKITGYSIFANGKLKKYGILVVDIEETNSIERMEQMFSKIKDLIGDTKPDYIVFEHCQFQNNYGVFQLLSQLQGIIMAILFEIDIGFAIIEPTAWKSFCGVKGRKRKEQKMKTQQFVLEKFNKTCGEDESDAIAIGWWATNNIKEEKVVYEEKDRVKK